VLADRPMDGEVDAVGELEDALGRYAVGDQLVVRLGAERGEPRRLDEHARPGAAQRLAREPGEVAVLAGAENRHQAW
jgi:hypothetical protein